MSGLFGSVTIKGNRITDFAQQTATVGISMPYGVGKFVCEGNVIFAALPPKEHVKKKKQGKGGVKTETYSYTMSYAVAFCQGPIYGFWTIKRNGKIVYTQDPAASVDDQAYAAKWIQKVNFYYGTKTQMPDSVIEAYKGAGQVSAFRNVSYFSVEDDDVTDGNGAVPTYEAVCIAHGYGYATSPPYVAEVVDGLDSSSNVRQVYELIWPVEATNSNSTLISGYLQEILRDYTIGADAADSYSTITEGSLREILRTTQMLPDAADSYSDIIAGSMYDILIEYTMLTEAMDSSSSLISGSLT